MFHSHLPEVQEQEQGARCGEGRSALLWWCRAIVEKRGELSSWVPGICSLNLGFGESLSFTGDFPFELRDRVAKVSI